MGGFEGESYADIPTVKQLIDRIIKEAEEVVSNIGAGGIFQPLRKPTDGCFHETICRVKAAVEYFPEYLTESRNKQMKVHWQAWRKTGRAYWRAD